LTKFVNQNVVRNWV